MTSEEIETKRVEVLKSINDLREKLNLLQEERFIKEREIMSLAESIRQAKHLLAVKRTEAEILQSEYWRARQ